MKRPRMAGTTSSRLLKNVFEAADARQKWPKERSLHGVNEHLEAIFNAAVATQIVFQRPARQGADYPLCCLTNNAFDVSLDTGRVTDKA